KVRDRDSDGFIVQADVLDSGEIKLMFERVRSEFGQLDIFVTNARPELPTFFQPPMNITLEQWETAQNSQGKAFLLAVREADRLPSSGGRTVALTCGTGTRTGGALPWASLGSP